MTPRSRHRSIETSLGATGSTWRAPGDSSGSGNQRIGYREKSVILTSALHEYRRLRDQGKPVSVGEFCEKFPDYRKSLLRLIDVEENLGDLGEIDDPFPQVGGEFLGFEILSDLGMGAIARVYLAAEPELGGRIVVIKVAADGTAEAATLGKLQHPNIVQVYSVKRDTESGMTAVCMPYQGSATLTDVLDLVFRDGRAPESAALILDVASRLADMQALRDDDLATSRPDPILAHGSFVDGVVHLGIQLAGALEYAHASGVLHRDLKPSNILLTPHGRPMLLDFNLSFDAAHDAMPRGGTLPYMAPEQIRASLRGEASSDATLDPRPDVFSLGVILYELLTGKLPYGGPPEQLGPEGASLWQLNAHETIPPSICQVNPRVPAPIAAAIERCLATAPSQRFSSLAEVSAALRTHFSHKQRAVRWFRRHRQWCRAALLVMVLVASAAGAYPFFRLPLHQRQYQAAVTAYDQRNYDQAISLVGPAIASHHDFAQALLLRGMCQEAKGRLKDATTDFEQVARIAPSAAVWDHLGCRSYRIGRMHDAAPQFDKAIQLQPNHAKLYLKYAIAASKLPAMSKQAETYATRAIELDGQLTEAYLIRAEIHIKSGNPDGAIRDFKTAISLSPNSRWVKLVVTEKLSSFASKRAELKDYIRNQLEQAVALGLSKKSLTFNNAYRIYVSEPWCIELLSRAGQGTEELKSPIQEMMVPSLPLEIERL